MQKWQYVRLKIIFKGVTKKIIYQEDGGKPIPLTFPNSSEEQETIEGMKLNGWELVNTKKDYFYFKRPIE